MRLSRLFIIIMLCLAATLAAIVFVPDKSVATIACVLTIVVMGIFYRNVLKPLRSISNGLNLLHAQDFSSRLAHVGQYDADGIADTFNGLLAVLKEQRLHLREQNHFLDLLVDVSPMGIIIIKDDVITQINPAGAVFLEFKSAEDAIGVSLRGISSPLGPVIASLAHGDTRTVRLSDSMIYRCSLLSFMDKGYSHPFILVERLTDEVMKAEKKSYEKVIRVIAHEANNAMAGVDSMLMAIDSDAGSSQLDPEEQQEVINACRSRCKTLSRFISAFASAVKIPEAATVRTDLNSILRQWEVSLESLCHKSDTSLCLNLCAGELPVMLDPVLMEQVVTNIVKNSAESIGRGGHIAITTSDNPVSFVVTDDGAGISPEATDMLFSPFFTTKPKGHGIGLLFVSDVLHKHGCRFSLATGADGLTRFTVRFNSK